MRTKKLPGDWVIQAFSRGGANNQALTELEPQAVYKVLHYPDLITAADVNRLLLSCASISGNSNFGLSMVHLADPAMLGTYAFLLENAGTVDDFFRIAQRYYPVFYRGATLEYRSDKNFLRLRYCVENTQGICSRHDNEWTLGFFVSFLKRKLDDSIVPAEVFFSSPQSGTLKQQKCLFGKNLYFDQTITELVYPASIAKAILNYSDPGLLRVLREHAEYFLTLVGEENSFSNKVRMLINDALESGNVKASRIAEKLGVSVSAMKRALAAEGSNFRQLKLDVMAELARKLLLHTDSSICEISVRLGYSDQSAFSRAFSRQYGQSPRQYRGGNRHKDR